MATRRTAAEKAADDKAAADKAAEDQAAKDQAAADKKAEDDKAAADAKATETKESTLKPVEEDRKAFVESNKPTDEKYHDAETSNANLPAHHDPVVVDDHKQASRAAEADQSKLRKAVRVQVSQFDTSGFGASPLDALSDDPRKDDKKDSDKSK